MAKHKNDADLKVILASSHSEIPTSEIPWFQKTRLTCGTLLSLYAELGMHEVAASLFLHSSQMNLIHKWLKHFKEDRQKVTSMFEDSGFHLDWFPYLQQ